MHAGDRLNKMEAVASGQPASIVAQRRVKSQLGTVDMVKKSIATVSISGNLTEKLKAISEAGFEG